MKFTINDGWLYIEAGTCQTIAQLRKLQNQLEESSVEYGVYNNDNNVVIGMELNEKNTI